MTSSSSTFGGGSRHGQIRLSSESIFCTKHPFLSQKFLSMPKSHLFSSMTASTSKNWKQNGLHFSTMEHYTNPEIDIGPVLFL